MMVGVTWPRAGANLTWRAEGERDKKEKCAPRLGHKDRVAHLLRGQPAGESGRALSALLSGGGRRARVRVGAAAVLPSALVS